MKKAPCGASAPTPPVAKPDRGTDRDGTSIPLRWGLVKRRHHDRGNVNMRPVGLRGERGGTMCEFVGWCSLTSEAQAAWVQAVGTLIALLIAVCVPWAAHKAALKAQRQALRPRLSFHTQVRPGESEVAVDLISHGLGPAIITDFRAELDGRRVNLEPSRALLDIGSALKLAFRATRSTSVRAGAWMASGERHEIFALVDAGDAMSFYYSPGNRDLETELSRLVFTVEYESVFGEKFGPITTKGSFNPGPAPRNR